jgi:ferredoxin-NADP reductase
MAPAGAWRNAVVRDVRHPSPSAVVLRMEVRDRIDHLPGQHYVIRLTADDGYVAARSYSLSSAPSDPLIEMYVERLAGGEVSGYLSDVVQPGDELEVRGPIGGWFVWDATSRAVGIGGGTGVAPLVAMLRHADHVGRRDLLNLVVSARTRAELPYAHELGPAAAVTAVTREASLAGRAAGRLVAAEIQPVLAPGTTYLLCGSTGFTEAVSDLLMDLRVPAAAVRVERFGPSG